MSHRLTSFQRGATWRSLVATHTLMAAALLVAVIAQAQTGGGGGGQPGGTTLPPEQVQQAEKTGTELADAERQLETGEKILTDKDGNPLPKKDLEAKVKNAKDLEKNPGVNDEYKKIVKRAYLNRKKKYLEDDRNRAQRTGDDKAERRAKRQLQELDDELKKITAAVGDGPALPEGSALASTKDVPEKDADPALAKTASQSGMITVRLAGTYNYRDPSKKGHSKEMATADIAKANPTHAVIGTLTGREENPERWKLNLTAGYTWTFADEKAPIYGYGGKTAFSIDYVVPAKELQLMHDRYSHLNMYGSDKPSSGVSSASYGIQRLQIPRFPFQLPEALLKGDGKDRIYDVPFGEIPYGNPYSYIYRLKSDVNVSQAGNDLERAGFSHATGWSAWENPFGPPIFAYSLNDPLRVDRLRAVLGPRVDIFEANEDRGEAPAPSLDPTRWPVTRANPLPRLWIPVEETKQ